MLCYTVKEKERLGRLGVNSRVKFVANGVDTTRFTLTDAESELIQHMGLVVLFVVDSSKGNALVMLSKQFPRLQRLVTGQNSTNSNARVAQRC